MIALLVLALMTGGIAKADVAKLQGAAFQEAVLPTVLFNLRQGWCSDDVDGAPRVPASGPFTPGRRRSRRRAR